MWIVNYFRELGVWRLIRKIYKQNKSEFEKIGIKSDWFGRLWKVINRDSNIPLGSEEDKELLMEELVKIDVLLRKLNIMEILDYQLTPIEETNENDNTFENAYLITLTPAYSLSRQYVTTGSTIGVILGGLCIVGGLGYTICHFLF